MLGIAGGVERGGGGGGGYGRSGGRRRGSGCRCGWFGESQLHESFASTSCLGGFCPILSIICLTLIFTIRFLLPELGSA